MEALPLFARLAGGWFPRPDQVPRLVRAGYVGSLGETALHWFMRYGRADLCRAWFCAGGAYERDAKGNAPLHWLAGCVGLDAVKRVIADPRLLEALAPYASQTDAGGRDPLGLWCLCFESEAFVLFLNAFPELASWGVDMGLGERLNISDSWIAMKCMMFDKACVSVKFDWPVVSARVPNALMRSDGWWTQELWEAAVQAFAPEWQVRAMEAGEITSAIEHDETHSGRTRPRL